MHESFKEFNNEKMPNNYIKKAIWNNIGNLIVSASEDNIIRIFDLPFNTFYSIWHNLDLEYIEPTPLSSPKIIKEQNHIYDITMQFYNLMKIG